MSLFSQFFTTANAALLSYTGEPAVYRVGGCGPAMPITAGVSPESSRIEEGENGRVMHHTRQMNVQAAEIAAPARGDTITLQNGQVWTVESLDSSDNAGSLLNTVRPVTVDVTSKGYHNR